MDYSVIWIIAIHKWLVKENLVIAHHIQIILEHELIALMIVMDKIIGDFYEKIVYTFTN